QDGGLSDTVVAGALPRALLSLPRRGRVDASVSERPGGVTVVVIAGAPHPASLGYRLREATLPLRGRDKRARCAAAARLHFHPIARPLERGAGAIDRAFVPVLAHEHQADRQSVRHAAGNADRRMSSGIERAGVARRLPAPPRHLL